MKKIETLRYFPLAESMAPSSAILELFVSESPIFGFRTFWGQNSRTYFGDRGINLYQISGRDSPLICAETVCFGVTKTLRRFGMVAVHSGLGSLICRVSVDMDISMCG